MYDPDDPHYIPVLDHGFVYLVEVMGTDSSITQAARLSYGAGTKSVREDRGLIRYLFRHSHTSPIEMCEAKYHIRLPIFVARQLLRHRTANVNEYSARYSIVSDEFYLPEPDCLQSQSTDNRQGRDGQLTETSANGVQWLMQMVGDMTYDTYRVLLGERSSRDAEYPDDLIFDPYSVDSPLLDPEYPGLARELARTVLPVSYYTEIYWKVDLKNLFDMLKLRTDQHAQYEIRMFAEAMYALIKPRFPLAAEAYEDYLRDAMHLSRMEVALLTALLHGTTTIDTIDPTDWGMSKREISEFIEAFALSK